MNGRDSFDYHNLESIADKVLRYFYFYRFFVDKNSNSPLAQLRFVDVFSTLFLRFDSFHEKNPHLTVEYWFT